MGTLAGWISGLLACWLPGSLVCGLAILLVLLPGSLVDLLSLLGWLAAWFPGLADWLVV
jgi:hypothetical protein